MTDLSIVIPTLNEAQYLSQLLASLSRQAYTDFEVIVSDSMSSDDTAAIAERHGARVVEGPKNGPGFARNYGAQCATGETLLFLDADVMLPDETTLTLMMRRLDDAAVIGGTSTFSAYDGTRKEKFAFAAASRMLALFYRTHISIGAPGYFLFVRTAIFRKIGGFDETLPYCEDHDLIAKMKKHGDLAMVDANIAVSSRRLQMRGFVNTLRDYGIPTLYYFFDADAMRKRCTFTPSSALDKENGDSALISFGTAASRRDD